MKQILPLEGIIIQSFSIDTDNDWLMVQLDKTYELNSFSFSRIAIKRKDKEILRLKAKKQLVFFRIMEEETPIQPHYLSGKNFPFIDWAIAELSSFSLEK